MHDVLFGFNSVLPSQWYSPSSCGDADLKRQQIRTFRYNTTRLISLSELSSWEHYLLDIRVNKATAVKIPIVERSIDERCLCCRVHGPEFIPTQILRLWRLLCNDDFMVVFPFVTIFAVCPSGTQPSLKENQCLTIVLNQFLTAQDGDFRCQNANGRSARFENSFDNQFAVKAAQAATSYESFNIGIYRLNQTWFFLDDKYNSAPISYFNWAPGQPSSPNLDLDCVYLNTTDSLWYTESCTAVQPYFCELPALKSPMYCTDTAKADIFFHGRRSFASLRLGHSNAMVLQLVLHCLLLDKWFNNQQPDFCSDRFSTIYSSIMTGGITKNPYPDISIPIQVAQNYTEGLNCNCRRLDSKYGVKQLMIWIPNSDRYEASSPVSLDQLPSWQHFLLPIKFTKAQATYPLWIDSRMVEIVQPDRDNFIPTLVEFIWQLLCEQTNQSGPLPPPPFI
ncbi:unnamed protein product, partial [Mesorhabditis belari]|uniref:C-type lectin domain-containing protein n=1 Tax=Mesorhabditis belari TaxID=2138241 RepID=A0AAF3FQZ7_9BILA